MANITKDLGLVTAYGYHKAGGGTLTEAEFEQKMVDITTAADDAETAKDDAVAAKNAAEASARSISQSATQIATNTADIADLKEDLEAIIPSVITEYSGSVYNNSANNYYRNLDSAPLPGKTYIVKITANTAGNHTFQIGLTASASGMRDTLGTFDMTAGETKNIIYSPSSADYNYIRNSKGDDWNATFYEFYETLAEDTKNSLIITNAVEKSAILYDGNTFMQDKTIGPSGGLIDQTGFVLWFPKIVYKAGTVLSLKNPDSHRMYIRLWTDSISSATQTAIPWTSENYTLTNDCYVAVALAYKVGVSGSMTVTEAIESFNVILTENAQKGTHEQIAVNAFEIKKNSEEIAAIQESLTGIGGKSYVKGINHRGYNTEAPQNTIPAFKLSKKKGFDYVETDVRYTSDGVPVLLHDFEINYVARNADGSELTETINIADITYEQALQYVFCGDFYSEYPTQRITTFRDFMALCRNLGLHPYIELKSSAYNASVLVDIVRDYGMIENVTWISFGNNLLLMVKNADANARLGLLVTDVTETAVTQAQALKTTTNEVFISASSDSVNNVELCKATEIPMEVYTLNAVSSIVATNPYVSGITSDTLNASAVLYDAALT